MTPAARLSAAAAIFAEVMAGAEPADRILHRWARGRRYAGSGDRRRIREIVFAALRRRASLAWELWGPLAAEAAAGDRLPVLAASGHGVAELAALCGSGGHAPDPLSPAERQALADRESGRHRAAMPFHARMNIPAFLEGRFRQVFGPALEPALEALNQRAPADFRVNLARLSRQAALDRLRGEGLAAEPLALVPAGIRLPAGELRDHPLLAQGALVPQDAASQRAAMLVGAGPGMAVLDLCAGAGGKTLAMAASMAGQGRLLAADQAADRLARLPPRARQAGIAVELAGWPPDPALCGAMDRVLVDAPCSGTGTWRRAPEDRWRLTEARLAALRGIQHDLLDLAAGYVRPGGWLVYATCSLLPEEGEEQVLRFLGRRPDFAPLAGDEGPEGVGDRLSLGPRGAFVRLAPHSHATDGFFVARLLRRAG